MSKYNLQSLLLEMTNDEFRDAQEKDRLENHPERDKIKAIMALMAKEKNKKIDPDAASVDKDGNIEDEAAGEFAEVLGVKSDDGTEDNVDNIDRVASPKAKASDYSAAIGSERSEDDKEQSDITQTTKPMYEDMNLTSLAKKLGIDIDDLKGKIEKMKSKEKDEIEANAKSAMAENKALGYLDKETSDRIEGMLNIPMKKKFMDTGMDLIQDILEEDPFQIDDIITHLANELGAYYDSFLGAGDRLANMGGIDENGDVEDYAEEINEAEISEKDIIKALKAANAQDYEIEVYMKSLKKAGDKFDEVDDYVEDFMNYVADKSLQEHFNRFM